MTPMLPALLGRAALLPLVAMVVCATPKSSPCDALWDGALKKPAPLERLGCKQRQDLQNSPWEGRYRVPGRQAAEVEGALAAALTMKRLERTCCVWESTNNAYRDARGRLWVISMATEETTVASRDRWAEIPYFYVTVDRYVDEP